MINLVKAGQSTGWQKFRNNGASRLTLVGSDGAAFGATSVSVVVRLKRTNLTGGYTHPIPLANSAGAIELITAAENITDLGCIIFDEIRATPVGANDKFEAWLVSGG